MVDDGGGFKGQRKVSVEIERDAVSWRRRRLQRPWGEERRLEVTGAPDRVMR